MNNLTDTLIDEALQTYPLALPPQNLKARIMRQVYQTQPAPKFRLTWMDYALGFFMTTLTGVALLVVPLIPVRFWLELRYAWILLQTPSMQPLLLTLLVTAAGIGLIGMLALFQLGRRILWA